MNRTDFSALYRSHYPSVLGVCRRMLGGATDAEDAAQEVFMRAYRAIDRFRPEDEFGRWIRAIASNFCIDALRRRKRLTELFVESIDPDAEAGHDEANGIGPLIEAYAAVEVANAVDALPERYRLPIVMAYYADASYEEIAEALGTTRNHVGVLLLRGKERLRRDLHEVYEESRP